VPFVVIDTLKKNGRLRAGAGGGHLRLAKCLTKTLRDAHDFAGRAHLRPKRLVSRRGGMFAGKTGEFTE